MAWLDGITICNCGYKTTHTPPPLDKFEPFKNGSEWGTGNDSHAWFHFEFDVPENMRSKPVQLCVMSDKTGGNAKNPQFIAYVNGVLRQGLDVFHTFVTLGSETHYDVYIYAYTGPRIPNARLNVGIRNVNYNTEQLYYDITVPYDMLSYLDENSKEYYEIVKHLDYALGLLDLYAVGSPEFFKSVDVALDYMQNEFYGKYCSAEELGNTVSTVGIGHTHIDCAWQWTLEQTREKVQRSFATALELMDRYPEYKFMSSQPLLYKYLKEEAPELYDKVKQRVKEGRWEVEGAMYVEPDCNLSSGESLVRQVIYGKRFFKEEFGTDSHILWLPDVFGYSAALPQILRKSGVDWFVTSKIAWNDTNMMPYDTFSWVGIDGTRINTYFLTAQDQPKSGMDRYTTYVGHTGSKMISGTWNRYQQKELTNEALLTFGYGDGGGGPTPDMLEMARRTAKGIHGAPLFKMDFAGDFLKRLEKKIENNPLLPTWRGELYLEFHRGTYTSICKNKKYNRHSEFLYLDAEHVSVMNKALCGKAFPKAELRDGWETILINQFHDIIPGSSIQEVYEVSDRDYERIGAVADNIIDGAKNEIASKLDQKGGYVVFNPHSFSEGGAVELDGKTAIVNDKLPSKGYKLTNNFVRTNNIKIDGKYVETNRFKVLFDEHMQIISIYDKLCRREIIESGKAANEIRIYADYPDIYDNWEWQEYSLEKYMALTDVESVTEVNDGARRGLRIVRPYRQSKVTQTIWFWNDIAKIDFDTHMDWHQHHIMVKAGFPTNINTDKATYEIQFGTVERPTHKNTSWDRAKFEVCAQKFADISEGGYGVSIINDCKYGHDIHDGDISLSLLKCGTFPNEDADQGEMTCVYSLCPHAGRFDESDTTKLSYYLNYPLTAIKATGEESVIPESFSAVTLDHDNVICETVKESEDGEDTIIRLYESKNVSTHLTLTTDISFEKAYICDLMENEICELEVTNGEIKLDVGCFEIVTVKLK